MNLQKNNKTLYSDIFQLLPTQSFVLTLDPLDVFKNILFISTIEVQDFFALSEPVLKKQNINYQISEDAYLLDYGEQRNEIAYVKNSEYIARVFPTNIATIQSRSTSWSIGPWIIECFWANILGSTLFMGQRDLEKDKASITERCPKLLLEFLNKEIENKSKLLQSNDSNSLKRDILVAELRIAYIRRIFIQNNLFLCGLHKVDEQRDKLPEKDKALLSLCEDTNTTDFLHFTNKT